MLKLFSPAKLNLFLSVVRRREDGFHDLASLFQAIDLGDHLTLSLSDRDHLKITGPFAHNIPTNESNLIFKAAALFRKKTGAKFNLEVILEKYIPVEAGLGGGSSNAATALWGINQLLGCPATLQDLIAWSGEIGSDITFFLSNGTAYCTSRGEVIESLDCFAKELYEQTILIIKPPEGLSTPAVFKALDLSRLPKRDVIKSLSSFYQAKGEYFNDLEIPAFILAPQLEELKLQLINYGFEHVVMTGTGSTFFCIGRGQLPKRADLFSCTAKFIRREELGWYQL